jgi:hypothetical protein
VPVQYTYKPVENVISVECFGELTIDEITEYFSDLEDDVTIPTGAAELVDLTKITYFNIEHTDVFRLPASYSPAKVKKEISATLLFGYTRINMGLTRLIEAYFHKNMPDHFFVVVESQHEAMQILLQFRQKNSAKEA